MSTNSGRSSTYATAADACVQIAYNLGSSSRCPSAADNTSMHPLSDPIDVSTELQRNAELDKENAHLRARLLNALHVVDRLVEDPYCIPTGRCACAFCGDELTTRYELKIHLQEQHGKTLQDLHRCSGCEARFIEAGASSPDAPQPPNRAQRLVTSERLNQ
ncbi:hypothetical protein EXIGLDRAFT_350964 [Exidia glandulosa HHB12029]|uniref:C2H2-type domain-containing protein n=1 Tax=Exidia glandulosa HHB12029 TaxID=1314781 RepID=A0A165ZFL2_EXIGL|nr:hypothetical protein EXIGLDRAFT_350964 [Exidia glandulosa HHB12029]